MLRGWWTAIHLATSSSLRPTRTVVEGASGQIHAGIVLQLQLGHAVLSAHNNLEQVFFVPTHRVEYRRYFRPARVPGGVSVALSFLQRAGQKLP